MARPLWSSPGCHLGARVVNAKGIGDLDRDVAALDELAVS